MSTFTILYARESLQFPVFDGEVDASDVDLRYVCTLPAHFPYYRML